ncbi:hypothetical protein BS78_08G016700 [Paspalum vaginatum]|nr:hypothetical protein BS78_08G016700 [Paspalum vaginatum]
MSSSSSPAAVLVSNGAVSPRAPRFRRRLPRLYCGRLHHRARQPPLVAVAPPPSSPAPTPTFSASPSPGPSNSSPGRPSMPSSTPPCGSPSARCAAGCPRSAGRTWRSRPSSEQATTFPGMDSTSSCTRGRTPRRSLENPGPELPSPAVGGKRPLPSRQVRSLGQEEREKNGPFSSQAIGNEFVVQTAPLSDGVHTFALCILVALGPLDM